MKNVKDILICIIVALIVAIPLFIMVYAVAIKDYEMAFTCLMSMFIWTPIVILVFDKIDDKINK